MSEILFVINGMAITAGALLALIGGLALTLLAGLLFVLIRQSRTRALEAQEQNLRAEDLQQQLFELLKAQSATAGQVQFLAQGVGSKQEELTRTVNERLDSVTQRLGENMTNAANTTAESLSKLHERLAVVDAAQTRMAELTDHMVTLKDVLANKQARGAFGQGQMQTIIADWLPRESYEFQFTLSNNKRPDCIVRMPNDQPILVIDAKFPLEAITAFREAQTEDERKNASARLKQDINAHINSISEKYIVAGETQDTALMFVPAESVYADLHEHFHDLIQKAQHRRVLIVSPTLLTLSIQVIRSIMKDARMREQAEVIQKEVSKLVGDVRRLRDRAANLQRHFAQASDDVGQVLMSADKIERHSQAIEQVEFKTPEDGKVGVKDAGGRAAIPLQLKLGGRD